MTGCKQQSNVVYQQVTLNMNHGTSGTLEVSLDEVSLDTFTRVSTSDSHQMKRNRMKCHWIHSLEPQQVRVIR